MTPAGNLSPRASLPRSLPGRFTGSALPRAASTPGCAPGQNESELCSGITAAPGPAGVRGSPGPSWPGGWRSRSPVTRGRAALDPTAADITGLLEPLPTENATAAACIQAGGPGVGALQSCPRSLRSQYEPRRWNGPCPCLQGAPGSVGRLPNRSLGGVLTLADGRLATRPVLGRGESEPEDRSYPLPPPGTPKAGAVNPGQTASPCYGHFDLGPRLEQERPASRLRPGCPQRGPEPAGPRPAVWAGGTLPPCALPPQAWSTSMRSTACRPGSSRTLSGSRTRTSCPGSLRPSSSTTGYRCCGAPTASATPCPPSP